jgi:hypothetical protein
MHSNVAEEHAVSIITITTLTIKAANSSQLLICFYCATCHNIPQDTNHPIQVLFTCFA